MSPDFIDRLLLTHRARIERLLLAAALASPPLTLAAAACVALRVVDLGAMSGPAVAFLVLYLAPLMLVAPLWLRGRLDVSAGTRMLDLAVLALSFARFLSGILPFSGHMLFLTYSLLARPVSTRYRLVAAVLIVDTTAFKLWFWRDMRSWTIGIVAGLLAVAIGWALGDGPPQRDPRLVAPSDA